MGMYSWYEYQYGMYLNPNFNDKVDEIREKLAEKSDLITLEEDTLSKNRIRYVFNFDQFTDVKLFGYFYPYSVELLYFIAEHLDYSSESEENKVIFSYEEGFHFYLKFVQNENGQKIIQLFEQPNDFNYVFDIE